MWQGDWILRRVVMDVSRASILSSSVFLTGGNELHSSRVCTTKNVVSSFGYEDLKAELSYCGSVSSSPRSTSLPILGLRRRTAYLLYFVFTWTIPKLWELHVKVECFGHKNVKATDSFAGQLPFSFSIFRSKSGLKRSTSYLFHCLISRRNLSLDCNFRVAILDCRGHCSWKASNNCAALSLRRV